MWQLLEAFSVRMFNGIQLNLLRCSGVLSSWWNGIWEVGEIADDFEYPAFNNLCFLFLSFIEFHIRYIIIISKEYIFSDYYGIVRSLLCMRMFKWVGHFYWISIILPIVMYYWSHRIKCLCAVAVNTAKAIAIVYP